MQIKGGFARRNSVTFLSERFVATAKRDNSDLIVVTSGKKFLADCRNPLYLVLNRIPFVRGIVSLAFILFQSKLVALVIIASVFLAILPETALASGSDRLLEYLDLTLSILALAVIGSVFFRFSRVKRYHGAEHKAANAYVKSKVNSVENARRFSRIHERCGTNFLVMALIMAIIIQPFFAWDFDYSLMIGIVLASEMAKLENKTIKRPMFWAGGLLQKYFFTAEPGDKELEVAVTAIRALEELEGNR